MAYGLYYLDRQTDQKKARFDQEKYTMAYGSYYLDHHTDQKKARFELESFDMALSGEDPDRRAQISETVLLRTCDGYSLSHRC